MRPNSITFLKQIELDFLMIKILAYESRPIIRAEISTSRVIRLKQTHQSKTSNYNGTRKTLKFKIKGDENKKIIPKITSNNEWMADDSLHNENTMYVFHLYI